MQTKTGKSLILYIYSETIHANQELRHLKFQIAECLQ